MTRYRAVIYRRDKMELHLELEAVDRAHATRDMMKIADETPRDGWSNIETDIVDYDMEPVPNA
jgi:hypothetical protein